MVEVSRQTGQGSVWVGMAAVVCKLRCCHKIESEHTFLMAVTGEGQCR